MRRVLSKVASDDVDVAKKHQLSKWDVCRDPGVGVGLCQPLLFTIASREHQIKRRKRCNAELTFAGDICRIPPSDLPADTIVRSTGATMWIGEHLSVDHIKLLVSMFQVSSSVPSRHVFAVANLVEVLVALALQPGGRCEQYSFELVYVTDWTNDVMDSLAFSYPVVGSDPSRHKTISLVEWRARLQERTIVESRLSRANGELLTATTSRTRATSSQSKALTTAQAAVSKQAAALAEIDKDLPQQDWEWIPRKVRGIIVRGALFPAYNKVDLVPHCRRSCRSCTREA